MTRVATLAGGRYRLERVLGIGGMARVHAGYDEELHRRVAVKLLAEHLAGDADFRRRFLREAKVAARLSHPHVVAVYDAGEEDGRPFIVMELVEGETLADVLARRRPLPAGEVLGLGRQAAAGLAHAHAHGVVHRDVKPQNLLLGAGGTLKIADFGIARPATSTERLTQIGTILGTAAYLSPEQAAGREVTAAADVYGLGVVLYEALTGRTPFAADSLQELVEAQQQGTPAPVRELAPATPAWLEEVVMRCLARRPEFRPVSGAEVESLLGAGPERAATVPLSAGGGTRRSGGDGDVHLHLHHARARLAAAALALAAVAAVVAIALASSDGGGSHPAFPADRPGKPAQQARDLAQWLDRASR